MPKVSWTKNSSSVLQSENKLKWKSFGEFWLQVEFLSRERRTFLLWILKRNFSISIVYLCLKYVIANEGLPCGQEELIQCSKQIRALTATSEFNFVDNKEELDRICPWVTINKQALKFPKEDDSRVSGDRNISKEKFPRKNISAQRNASGKIILFKRKRAQK